jgi:hypothetical protein
VHGIWDDVMMVHGIWDGVMMVHAKFLFAEKES